MRREDYGSDAMGYIFLIFVHHFVLFYLKHCSLPLDKNLQNGCTRPSTLITPNLCARLNSTTITHRPLNITPTDHFVIFCLMLNNGNVSSYVPDATGGIKYCNLKQHPWQFIVSHMDFKLQFSGLDQLCHQQLEQNHRRTEIGILAEQSGSKTQQPALFFVTKILHVGHSKLPMKWSLNLDCKMDSFTSISLDQKIWDWLYRMEPTRLQLTVRATADNLVEI